MPDLKALFDRYSDLMYKHNKAVEVGCYTVALLGFAVAVRRVRPFTKFCKPSQIPKRFIKEKREMYGTVERIDPATGILLLQHKPLIPLPFVNNDALPVKISGVKVSGLGTYWLNAIVVGNEVKFIPTMKMNDCVKCEVILSQKSIDDKIRAIDVGESLVSIGFGTIDQSDTVTKNNEYKSYYKRLKSAELQALKKKLGLKYYILPIKTQLSYATKGASLLLDQIMKRSNKVVAV